MIDSRFLKLLDHIAIKAAQSELVCTAINSTQAPSGTARLPLLCSLRWSGCLTSSSRSVAAQTVLFLVQLVHQGSDRASRLDGLGAELQTLAGGVLLCSADMTAGLPICPAAPPANLPTQQSDSYNFKT